MVKVGPFSPTKTTPSFFQTKENWVALKLLLIICDSPLHNAELEAISKSSPNTFCPILKLLADKKIAESDCGSILSATTNLIL